MILILDIDDTLASTKERNHFVDKPNPSQEDWDKFFDPELMDQDEPIPEAQQALENILPFADDVYFITGRPEYTRDVTESWLHVHYGFNDFDKLFMRDDDDRRRSADFKESVLKEEILPKTEGKTLVMIDDGESILEMFDEYGIPIKAPEGWDAFITG